VAVVVLIVRAGQRGNGEAWLLAGPFTLSCIDIVYLLCNGAFTLERKPAFATINNFLDTVFTWPVHLSAGPIIAISCNLSVCAVLILRFARSRRDEERLSAELEAARVVQQVLVPTEVPTIPGYEIESVYKPAGQVGGDFFQIIALESGGALIAIGDVSGKGMPAAMTVSLLVGTFRTLAHYTQSPAEILAAMNTRMLARSHGGFTTCLVLRLEANGGVVAANAGHIAPYIDGREIELSNGLPLGLVAGAEYAETITRLTGRMVLVTDGVVEARNDRGELFGFERTRELSMKPAEALAAAAQRFGQEDDITVFSVSLSAVAVPA
jgi:serine phosphatase RsbU (regulator of sigma subunit)